MTENWKKEFHVKLPSKSGQKRLGPSIGEMPIAGSSQRIDEIKKKYTTSKSLLLFDATVSMKRYWNVTMQSIDTIVHRILEVGGQHSVAMKIVAYRDYCDGDKLIEESPWSQSASELRVFIAGIQPIGGGDIPEAVDRALQLAIREPEVSRIILIGDAPPHPEQDCRREATELGQMTRPVYPILVEEDAATKEAFRMIADLSGGKLIELTHLEELFELVALLIVHDVGGEEKVKEYTKHYQLTSGGVRLVKMLTSGAPARRLTEWGVYK